MLDFWKAHKRAEESNHCVCVTEKNVGIEKEEGVMSMERERERRASRNFDSVERSFAILHKMVLDFLSPHKLDVGLVRLLSQGDSKASESPQNRGQRG